MASYVSVSKPADFTEKYLAQQYVSPYQGQLDSALKNVVDFKYDPMKDAAFRSLANVYAERGNRAAKNTLGDAASLNGGYGTSYAVSAAQQTRNQYNQELMSYVPELEERAYTRANGTLTALRGADETAYGRFRDDEADRKYAYEQAYKKYRDAMADYQWGIGYNLDVDKYNLDVENSKKYSSSGGGGYSGGGYDDSFASDVWNGANSLAQQYYSNPNRAASHTTTKTTTKQKATNPYVKYSPKWYQWEAQH